MKRHFMTGRDWGRASSTCHECDNSIAGMESAIQQCELHVARRYLLYFRQLVEHEEVQMSLSSTSM